MDPIFPQERGFVALHGDPARGNYRRCFFLGSKQSEYAYFSSWQTVPLPRNLPGPWTFQLANPNLIIEQDAEEG